MPHGSLNNYSHYFDGIVLIEDIDDSKLIDVSNESAFGGTDPKVIIEQQAKFVGALFEEVNDKYSLLGTATIVGKNTILSARHCVNDVMLGDLRFTTDGTVFYSLSVIEDGSAIGEDYILLKANPGAQQATLNSFIPAESELPSSEYILSISCVIKDHKFRKVAAMSYIEEEDGGTLEQVTTLPTSRGFSGTPYIRSTSRIVGIHLKSENLTMFAGQKCGLPFEKLKLMNCKLAQLLKNPEFILSVDVSFFEDDVFDDFSTAGLEGVQEDEGKKRKHTFDKTPNLKSKPCKAVLKRWEEKAKAKYIGTFDGIKKYRDIDNWQVFVKKEEDKSDWVCLTEKRTDTDRAAIEMGHKLSCSAFWNKGAQPYIETREEHLNKKYAADIPTRDKKIADLRSNYLPYKKPFMETYAELYDGSKSLNSEYRKFRRAFMNDHKNYRFEWSVLNQTSGKKDEEAYAAPKGFEWQDKEEGSGKHLVKCSK